MQTAPSVLSSRTAPAGGPALRRLTCAGVLLPAGAPVAVPLDPDAPLAATGAVRVRRVAGGPDADLEPAVELEVPSAHGGLPLLLRVEAATTGGATLTWWTGGAPSPVVLTPGREPGAPATTWVLDAGPGTGSVALPAGATVLVGPRELGTGAERPGRLADALGDLGDLPPRDLCQQAMHRLHAGAPGAGAELVAVRVG